jgi:hypothetical protein
MNFIELLNDIPGVKAITTTVGFNACNYAGADADSVVKDREALAEYFGVTDNDLFIPVQTHSTNVAMPGEDLQDIDAVVTNKPNQVIAVNTADCLPLILVDSAAKVIAAVHCGWRGTVGGIAVNAVRKMISLGANPHNIIAAMGPCIGVGCFEVGEEVAVQFPNTVVNRSYAKPHVDLSEAVAEQLISTGIARENITKSIACSLCDDRFYSVRRQGRTLPFRTLTAIALL